MTIEEVKEINNKYPEISKYILLAKNSKQGNVGQITTFIERDKRNSKQKLTEWIKYWVDENIKQAVLIIKGLRYIDEEQKEELKQIVYDKLELDESKGNKRVYKKLLTSLYFEEFNKTQEIYNEYKWNIKLEKNTEDTTMKYERSTKYINISIVNELFNSSDYRLILKYINILQKCYDYEKIKYIAKLISRTINKRTQKDLIQEIINTCIEQDKIEYAFKFLYLLNIKDYLEYMPKDKTDIEYMEMLNKVDKDNYVFLEIQKDLFFNKNYKKYNNLVLCTQKWIEYLENNTETMEKIHIIQEESAILDCIKNDITLLDNNDYIKKKIKEIAAFIEKENIKVDLDAETDTNTKYFENLINIINKIISDSTNFESKKNKIENLGILNVFAYKEEYKKVDILYYNSKYRSIVNNSRQIYKKYMEKKRNGKKLLYLYMNTHWKYSIAIEELLSMMEQNNIKIPYGSLERYNFYGNIRMRKSSQRVKLRNVLNINRTRIINSDSDIGQQVKKCMVKIIGINRIYNELIIQVVKIISKEPIANLDKIQAGKVEGYCITLKNKEIDLIKNINKNNSIDITKNSMKKIAKTHIEMLEDFSEKTIDIIKVDNINPFKFINQKQYRDKVYSKNVKILKKSKDLIKSCKTKYNKKINCGLEEYYKEFVKEKYKNILENEENSIEDVVYYYMNTSTKYIISLNEFMDLIAITRFKNQKDINIYNMFKDYPIIFKEIIDNKIAGLEFLQGENIILEGLEYEKEIYKDGISYLTSLLVSYNTTKKEFYINRVKKSYIKVNSEEYERLIKIIIKFLYSRNLDLLKQIKDMKRIPELWECNYEAIKNDYFIVKDLQETCINVFTVLMNDVEKLKLFIQALDNNNIFRWDRFFNNYALGKNDFKSMFFNQINKDNIETIIYCYQNSFLKNMIKVEEIINEIFIYNEETKLINEKGTIDLSKYNFNIKVKIKDKNGSVIKAERVKKFDDNLQISIKEIKDRHLNTKELKIVEYNAFYRNLKCEEKKGSSYDKRRIYNIYYIHIVNEILKKDYSIIDIYKFYKKANIKYENKYYDSNYDNEYYYVLKNSILLKYLKRNFKKYIDRNRKNGRINKNNVKMLNEMISKSIIKYVSKEIKHI